MARFGLLLAQHPELARSLQEANAMLEKAANSGSWKASVVLGTLARDGNGVPKDPAAAYYHFRIAVLQGGETAKHLLARDLVNLAAKLTYDQTQVLSSRAYAWSHEHPAVLEFVYEDKNYGKQAPAQDLTFGDEAIRAGQLFRNPLSDRRHSMEMIHNSLKSSDCPPPVRCLCASGTTLGLSNSLRSLVIDADHRSECQLKLSSESSPKWRKRRMLFSKSP